MNNGHAAISPNTERPRPLLVAQIDKLQEEVYRLHGTVAGIKAKLNEILPVIESNDVQPIPAGGAGFVGALNDQICSLNIANNTLQDCLAHLSDLT
jgi:prefoldin subunit 5